MACATRAAPRICARVAVLGLIREWVGIIRDEAAAVKMAEVQSNLDDTWFAWSGPTTAGSAVYFRIQGPTVFIEYAPQQRAMSFS